MCSYCKVQTSSTLSGSFLILYISTLFTAVKFSACSFVTKSRFLKSILVCTLNVLGCVKLKLMLGFQDSTVTESFVNRLLQLS